LVPLAEAARRAAAGDLEARVAGPLGRDEIGRFGAVFNRMMTDLQANVAGRIEATAARQAVESELEVALKIQRTLLPAPFPVIRGVEIATRFVPARYVAGDFYDHFHLGPDTLVVAIADVSGKGVAASLFMAAARTSIRNFTRPGVSPAQTLAAVNRALFEDNRQLVFVTTFLAHYELPTGRLTYVNAGHNLPYVLRSGGTPEVLGDSTGPLLAVFEGAEFGDREAQLGDGDTLVLYTDGVVEASDPGGELYGEERLEVLLRSNAAASPEALCTQITDAVQQHCRGAPQDDVTLLALRRQGLLTVAPG
jgi:sigma-B regulation protein RsbU (phosphoserine phosphatase)